MNSIELLCIDAEPIVIVSARRVHTKVISDNGKWTSTDFFFTTSDGAELEFEGMYEILDVGEWRCEVALKAFRVIDEPMKERWLKIVAQFLTMLQAATLEEVVKDEREEVKVEGQEGLKAA